MAKKIPVHPKHPERICWGCDRYCPVNSLACGNGTERTPHPVELFGEDWLGWGLDAPAEVRQAGSQPLATIRTVQILPGSEKPDELERIEAVRAASRE